MMPGSEAWGRGLGVRPGGEAGGRGGQGTRPGNEIWK